MKFIPKTVESLQLKPKDAVGHIVGNFLITGLAGNGRVHAKCLLCNNENYENQFYKIKVGHSTSCGCLHTLKDPKQHIGKKINKLTIKNIVKEKCNGAIQAKCLCECGNSKVVILNVLLRGKILSCGCAGKTRGGLSAGSNARIYDIWVQMMKRCYQKGGLVTTDPNLKFLNKLKPHNRYSDYGERGITVCRDWHNLDRFTTWYKNNIKQGQSMDRADNNKGYTPDNMRSAGVGVQNRDQRVHKDNKTGLKGIRHTGHTYRWTIKHKTKEIGKEGFATIEQALLERNIAIVLKGLPHAIQVPDYAYVLTISKGVRGGYHITITPNKFGNKDIIVAISHYSATSWSRKDHPDLLKVIAAMQQAHEDKFGLK